MEDEKYRIAYLFIAFIIFTNLVTLKDLSATVRKWFNLAILFIPFVGFVFIGVLAADCYNCNIPMDAIRPYFFGFLLSIPIILIHLSTENQFHNPEARKKSTPANTELTSGDVRQTDATSPDNLPPASNQDPAPQYCSHCKKTLPEKPLFSLKNHTCNCGKKYKLAREQARKTTWDVFINSSILTALFFQVLQSFEILHIAKSSMIIIYISLLLPAVALSIYIYFKQNTKWVRVPKTGKRMGDDAKILWSVLAAAAISLFLAFYYA